MRPDRMARIPHGSSIRGLRARIIAVKTTERVTISSPKPPTDRPYPLLSWPRRSAHAVRVSKIRGEFFVLVLVLGGVLGCGTDHAPPKEQKPGDLPPASVNAVRPERKSLLRVVEQPGTVRPYEETELYAKVSGYIAKMNADIGQKVRGPKFDAAGRETEPGEVLAELAVPELIAEEKQKQASVRQTRAEKVQAEKALASADANVHAMDAAVVEAKAGIARAQAHYDRWESEAKRTAGLVQRGVIDAQTRDETENQFKSAQAAREEARARVVSAEALVRKAKTDRDKSEADVSAAQARIDVAEADAGRLAALIGYTRIRAPYDAVVTRRRAHTGDLLQVSGPRGEALFTVARRNPVRLVVNVPEAEAALVQTGGEVRLTVPALKGSALKGKVTRTSWALEPGSRTLRTEIDAPNDYDRLRPGMYLYAHLTAQLPEEWVLPVAAVAKQGDMVVCFLIEDGKAVRTPVQLGHTDGKYTEVLRRQKPGAPPGWTEFTGKEAVAAKAAGLVDGQRVRVE
jgi:HlyD family secretion protein